MEVQTAVYPPPAEGLPHLAVIIGREGRIVQIETVASIEEGEDFLKRFTEVMDTVNKA